jgi:hypothetical protein
MPIGSLEAQVGQEGRKLKARVACAATVGILLGVSGFAALVSVSAPVWLLVAFTALFVCAMAGILLLSIWSDSSPLPPEYRGVRWAVLGRIPFLISIVGYLIVSA